MNKLKVKRPSAERRVQLEAAYRAKEDAKDRERQQQLAKQYVANGKAWSK